MVTPACDDTVDPFTLMVSVALSDAFTVIGIGSPVFLKKEDSVGDANEALKPVDRSMNLSTSVCLLSLQFLVFSFNPILGISAANLLKKVVGVKVIE